MPEYAQDALSAHNSIAEEGTTAILGQKVPGVFNPVTGTDTTETSQTYNVPVVVLPATIARFRGIDNKLVESGNLVITKGRYLIMSTLNTDKEPIPEPLPEMTVEFFGSVWRVLGCSPLNPAGTPILYQVGVVKIG